MLSIETPSKAKWLNQNCPCTSLERELLPKMEAAGALFSDTPVFLSTAEFEAMTAQIETLESVIGLPDYQEKVLDLAPAIASNGKGPSGVFMGYDFHMSEEGPRLIEINTNAGGAFLVDALYRAQDVCCWNGKPADNKQFAKDVLEMFANEWASAVHKNELKTVAIVDEEPNEQFLLPEFLLVAELLEQHGIKAMIADPSEFEFRQNALWLNGVKVDLIYNRSTDFYLEKPSHAALHEAFMTDAAVITPSPRHHALYAAKQNLAILSDADQLADIGATAEQIKVLSLLPKTKNVTPENADELWAARKQHFFKPLAGHGGKAVYRGDKVTKKTWTYILESAFVAQELAVPDIRNAKSLDQDGINPLKSDIRVFTYQGKTLLAAARLYQGQTTNFRTAGGGFAPIYVT